MNAEEASYSVVKLQPHCGHTVVMLWSHLGGGGQGLCAFVWQVVYGASSGVA